MRLNKNKKGSAKKFTRTEEVEISKENKFIDDASIPHDKDNYIKQITPRGRPSNLQEKRCSGCGEDFLVNAIFVRDGIYTCDRCLVNRR